MRHGRGAYECRSTAGPSSRPSRESCGWYKEHFRASIWLRSSSVISSRGTPSATIRSAIARAVEMEFGPLPVRRSLQSAESRRGGIHAPHTRFASMISIRRYHPPAGRLPGRSAHHPSAPPSLLSTTSQALGTRVKCKAKSAAGRNKPPPIAKIRPESRESRFRIASLVLDSHRTCSRLARLVEEGNKCTGRKVRCARDLDSYRWGAGVSFPAGCQGSCSGSVGCPGAFAGTASTRARPED